jgi:peptide/nickel transport system permease protein
MRDFLIRRTVQAVAVMFCISAITFFVLNVVPGDPVRIMLGDLASEEALETVRHRMGLDQPIHIQYFNWLTNMLQGDFGDSYFQRAPVLQLLGRSLKVTARLAGFAYLFALISGVTIGVLAAVNHGNAVDRGLMSLAVLGISAPAFWVALILQLVFALRLHWFPLSGTKTAAHFVLPVIALGSRYFASIARVTRTAMLDVLSQDFMRTAESKGLRKWTVILRHGLRNALIPIITIAGTQLGDIFTGSILVETIFSMNGVGSLMVNSITQRDLPLIEGGVIYIALICVIVYLVVDVLYAIVDPRIRLGGGES